MGRIRSEVRVKLPPFKQFPAAFVLRQEKRVFCLGGVDLLPLGSLITEVVLVGVSMS